MLAQKKVDPTPLTLTDKIRLINRDLNLSKGAKLLAIEIIIASNWRGYCWHSISAFTEMISSSETQVHSYLKELEAKDFIKIVRRPGTTNRYYLGPIFDHPEVPDRGVRNSEPKKENKYKTNVSNVTLKSLKEEKNDPLDSPTTTDTHDIHINIKPHKPVSNPFKMSLVKEILDLTNDKKSLGCYIKIVRTVPEAIIHTALSSLKIALNEGIVSNRGAYFVQTIKNHCPEVFCSSKTSIVTSSTPVKRIITQVKPATEPVVEPDEQPASHEEAMESLKKIKMMLKI